MGYLFFDHWEGLNLFSPQMINYILDPNEAPQETPKKCSHDFTNDKIFKDLDEIKSDTNSFTKSIKFIFRIN